MCEVFVFVFVFFLQKISVILCFAHSTKLIILPFLKDAKVKNSRIIFVAIPSLTM